MKTLYLLSSDGSFRRASSSEIADVLDGRNASVIGRLVVSDDGEAMPIALNQPELDELAEGLSERRDAELTIGLGRLLESRRRLDTITGVNVYGCMASIDLESAPWAEAAVRRWAVEFGLHVADETPPETTRWRRSAAVNLGPEKWATTIVTLHWPEVNLVARDAELDGRTTEAEAIRAEEAF